MTRAAKQRRMRGIWARMDAYIRSYDGQANWLDYSDNVFIDDVLYGLGISIDPKKYYGASGFDEFKKVLLQRVALTVGDARDA